MEKTVAILARTNLALRPFENALTEANIKYHLVGKSGYWATEEVKSSLSYLGCCYYPADWLIAGAIRAPFWPTKFLPKSTLMTNLKQVQDGNKEYKYWTILTTQPQALVHEKNLPALRDFTTFIHSLNRYRDLPAADALKSVLSALKVGDHFAEFEQSPDNDPLQNLSELIKMAKRFSSVKEFLDYCRRSTAASKSKKGVALSTCHSAKGMEFDTVYLVGCQDGMMPHSKATDLDEEKNIYFVACSRAERKLVISYSGIPSIFLKDVLECKKQENGNETSQPSNPGL